MGHAAGLLLMLAVPFAAVSAHASAADAPPSPPPPQAPIAVPQVVDSSLPSSAPAPPDSDESDLMTARRSDAAIDQAWLSPTAFTQSRGAVTVETHDLMLVTSSIGVADFLQLTFRLVPSFFVGDWFLSGGFKLRVLSTDHVNASVFANVSGLSGDTLLTAGAVATMCASASCGGAFSVYASVDPVNYRANGSNLSQWDTGYLYGASFVGALSGYVKLVAELNLVGYKGDVDYVSSALSAGAGMLGFRIFGRHATFTLGAFIAARQAIPGQPRDNGPWVLPALSLVGRFDTSPGAPRAPTPPVPEAVSPPPPDAETELERALGTVPNLRT